MNIPEEFEFPFQPYPIQHDFMRCLYDVIEHKKLGIFESPTGTGKSLSIICGAIRWLKDHNKYEREQIRSKIEDLEASKRKISSDSDDWLSVQSQEIELTRQINELRIQENKIKHYDEKIEKLKKKKTEVQKKMLIKSAVLVERDKNDEDDDIILETGSQSDEENDEEEDDAKYKPTKIFICSRTHSQLSQFIGEILKSPFGEQIRVASLASRQTYCINPNVSNLKSNSLINERCLDKQRKSNKSKKDSDGKAVKRAKSETSKCPYYKWNAIEDLRDFALTEVQDVEDLVKNAKQLNACPYYSSRLAAADAEVVLVPYNTILHKATREANGVDLKDNVIIIDEAHNLLEAMAQMHKSEVSYTQIDQGLLQVKCYKQRFHTQFSSTNLLSINQLIFVITKLQQLLDKSTETKTDVFTVENFVVTANIDKFNMFKLLKFCKDSRIAQKIRSYALKYPLDKTVIEKPIRKGVKDFLTTISSKTEAPVETNENKTPQFLLTNPLLAIISFLECLTYSYKDGRVFLHNNQDKSKIKLQFLLLNPSRMFEDVVKLARSVIVAGGTMKPNDEFKNRLFINSGASPERIIEFSCDHVIPADNILPIIVTEGSNKEKLIFNYEQRMSMGSNIKHIIQDTCSCVKGGIVVFFPSYNYESWVWQEIKDVSFGRRVFREPQDSGSVDSVLKSYADVIRKSGNALLFSVVGGKLSEGLNFSDDLGRCIIVVGLPYANITAPDLKEKMTYLDKTEGSGSGKKFYEGMCMKAVNQCIGRAVRHKDDYATILLLDERYNRSSTKDALPNWIKKSLKVLSYQETFQTIRKFFDGKKSD